MEQTKNTIINGIIRVEGGYVNDPKDSGGETKYGITKAEARAFGYMGNMKDLPMPMAFDIYSKKYWDALSLDAVATLSPQVAAEIADTAVNMGVHRSAIFVQRALNALNNEQKLYADVVVDGKLGKATTDAMRKYYTQLSLQSAEKKMNALFTDGSQIVWADMKFPPINLWSMSKMNSQAGKILQDWHMKSKGKK